MIADENGSDDGTDRGAQNAARMDTVLETFKADGAIALTLKRGLSGHSECSVYKLTLPEAVDLLAHALASLRGVQPVETLLERFLMRLAKHAVTPPTHMIQRTRMEDQSNG